MENNQNQNVKKDAIKRILFKGCAFAAIFVILLTFIFGITTAKNNNMSPSVCKNDVCIYTRIEPCSLEDVVVYKYNNKTYIGRIVAINGQTVDFHDGYMTIDNSIPLEQLPLQTYATENSDIQFPVTLNTDEFFILNDKRENTEDSRQYGIIKKKDIKGKITYLFRGGTQCTE